MSTTAPARPASGATAPDRALCVCHVPGPGPAPSGYVALLTAALARQGIAIAPVSDRGRSWPVGERRLDLVHLHWLEFIAPGDPGGPVALARSAYRYARLLWRLASLRRRGVAIVWTVHNLAPHEPVWPRLERLLGRAVMALCDRAIVHSEYARGCVQERFAARDKLVVVPHGNYTGVFPDAGASRAQLRRERGLTDDEFVYLAFGQVRPYKQLPRLLEAFAAEPGHDRRLIVAGKPVVGAEADELRRLAAADPRVILDLRELPDAEVCALHRCADAAVFAYGDMFSSGALLLALSQGLPVVVPEPSAGAELAGSPAVETFHGDGLAAALDRVALGDPAQRAAAAHAVAEAYPWERVAAATATVYGDARRAAARG